jgi:hypothetical protein
MYKAISQFSWAVMRFAHRGLFLFGSPHPKSEADFNQREGITMPAPSSLVRWVLFPARVSMHFLLQANASVNSRSNGLQTVRQWLALTWPTALVRLFCCARLCALAFGVWLDMPNAFNKLMASATGGAVTQALPLNRETVALFGHLADFSAR